MKTSFAALATLVAGVLAQNNSSVYYVTTTVDVLTTFCPSPTVITHGTLTSTITEATTLTITDCPCTAVIPVTIASSVACTTCAPAVNNATVPFGNSTAVVPPAGTGVAQTTPGVSVQTTLPAGGSTPSTTGVTFPGAANSNRAVAASGAGLAGFLAFVAYIL